MPLFKNTKKHFKLDDIAIIGRGCVLPGGRDPESFYQFLMERKPLIQNIKTNSLSHSRFQFYKYFFDSNRNADDKAYSDTAAIVEEPTIDEIAKSLSVSRKDYNRLEIMALESVSQALKENNLENLEEIDLYYGLMNPDEIYYAQKFYQERKKLNKLLDTVQVENKPEVLNAISKSLDEIFDGEITTENLLPTSLLAKLRKYFDIKKGDGVYLDTACGSSLTAIDIAVKKLKSGQSKYALAGGLESNLSMGVFVLFSKVGALCDPDKVGLPFDEKSTGLSQGEGAVSYMLTTMENALKNKHKIFGVIRGVGGASDGKSSSLFQPTVKGQVLAYSRAYPEEELRDVDFVEGHGTGTDVGDKTELRSLTEFFGNPKIPVGSVKTMVGHTKGAAGAASLMKGLKSLEHGYFPGTSNEFSKKAVQETNLVINKENFKLSANSNRLNRCGVSSFGFGGANYHLVLEQYKENFTCTEEKSHLISDEVVINAQEYFQMDEFEELLKKSNYKVPPKSIPQIDLCQMMGVFAVEQTFLKNRINPTVLDTKDIGVISSCIIGLDASIRLSHRSTITGVEDSMQRLGVDSKFIEVFRNHKNQYPNTTEDSGPGILNNVIAGRICNAFDFNGPSYNIDADLCSPLAAIDLGCLELKFLDTMFVLALIDEEVDQENMEVVRKGVEVVLLSNKKYSYKHELPILKTVRKIQNCEKSL